MLCVCCGAASELSEAGVITHLVALHSLALWNCAMSIVDAQLEAVSAWQRMTEVSLHYLTVLKLRSPASQPATMLQAAKARPRAVLPSAPLRVCSFSAVCDDFAALDVADVLGVHQSSGLWTGSRRTSAASNLPRVLRSCTPPRTVPLQLRLFFASCLRACVAMRKVFPNAPRMYVCVCLRQLASAQAGSVPDEAFVKAMIGECAVELGRCHRMYGSRAVQRRRVLLTCCRCVLPCQSSVQLAA